MRLYEQDALIRAAGQTLRPGSLTLTRRLVEACHLQPGAVVLDIGCGLGATVKFLSAQFRAFGIDTSRKLLDQGRGNLPSGTLAQSSGENLPFASLSMDAVFCECSLSVMPDVDRVIAECRRILKLGGKLAISDLYVRVPAGVEGLRSLPLASCLQGAMAKEAIFSTLRQHAFEPVLWEDHTHALKAFTAQLLFAHGSVEQFWCNALAGSSSWMSPDQVRQAVAHAKPGYFILIAQRG